MEVTYPKISAGIPRHSKKESKEMQKPSHPNKHELHHIPVDFRFINIHGENNTEEQTHLSLESLPLDIILVLDGHALSLMVDLVNTDKTRCKFEHVVSQGDNNKLRVLGSLFDV